MQPDSPVFAHLSDMRRYAMLIESFVKDVSFAEFAPDSMLRLATERAFEILGEAARKVPSTYRANFAEIPWAEVVGLRNVLAHEYGAIDPLLVWDTARQDVAPLVLVLDRALNAS